MFLVMPSDATTLKASEYLTSQNVQHMVMDIPPELEYKTAANVGIYLQGEDTNRVMVDLSAKGFVIMRVFKSFELC